MTEKEIQLLGFIREDYAHPNGDDYYYSYVITEGLSFITASAIELMESQTNEWYIDIFNTQEPIRFYNFSEVQALINKLEKAKIYEKK